MRRSARWSVQAGAAAMLALWAQDANAQACQRDLDCPGELICDGGQCMNQDGTPPAPGAAPPPAGAPPATATPGAPPPPAAVGAAPAVATAGAPNLPGQVTFYHDPAPLTVTHEGTGASCQTPCTMNLPIGTQWFSVTTGQGGRRVPLHVNGGPQSVEYRNFAGGQFAGGLVATILGAGALAGGLVVLLTGGDDSSSTSSTTSTSSSGHLAAGLPLTILGGAAFVAGVILLATSGPQMRQSNKPALQVAIVPRPEGGVSGGFGFSF